MMDLEGADQHIVIDTVPSSYFPDWSPDDSRLTFERLGEIWTANADGSNQLQLTESLGPNDGLWRAPSWSPDGSTIVFAELQGTAPAGALWAINPDGSNLRLILDVPGREEYPRWSPDGNTIAFQISTENGESDVYALDVASGLISQLSHTGLAGGPAWSKDGSQLSFNSITSEVSGASLFRINRDGSGLFRVTTHSQVQTVNTSSWGPPLE